MSTYETLYLFIVVATFVGFAGGIGMKSLQFTRMATVASRKPAGDATGDLGAPQVQH